MAKLLNSIYLGASTPSDYGNFVGGVELLPYDYYLGAATPGKPTYIDIILSGVSPLVLTQAIELNYLKLFGGTEQVPETYLDTVTLSGGCEQNGTPSPSQPLDIISNNGAIKVRNKSGLPLGYQRISYLESSGTEYINTIDSLLTSSDDVEIEFQLLNTTSATNFFGSRVSTTGRVYTLATSASGYWRFGWKSDTISITTIQPDTNKHTLRIDHTNQTLSLDGNVIYTYEGTDGDIETPTKAILFGIRSTTAQIFYLSSVRISSYKRWRNGSLFEHMVSCRRKSDSELGMYDLVNNTFSTNSGTGTFIAGADVDDLEIYTDGTQEVVTDSLGNTANAERLLAVGNYTDTQEVLTGSVNRQLGIYVLDGTETWVKSSTYTGSFYSSGINPPDGTKVANNPNVYCTHGFKVNDLSEYASATIGAIYWYTSPTINYKYDDGTATVAQFKQWLSDQYVNGTPVIVVYPLATATTETVSSQFLSKSPVTQTAGSISNLPIAITESEKTVPTPQQPLDINCNNGVLGIDSQGNITVTGTTETVEITGKNLFNPATKIEGYYIDANGNLVESEKFSYSALIPVVEGSAYTWSGTSTRIPLTGKRIHGYNSNSEWVQQIDYITTGSGNYSLSITIPSRIAYIRISGMRINEYPDTNVQVELGSTATTYEPYTVLGTAIAQPLYKVGTYQDEQSVIDGGVTRNVGIKVLDGTENWTESTTVGKFNAQHLLNGADSRIIQNTSCFCTHFLGVVPSISIADMEDLTCKAGWISGNLNFNSLYIAYANYANNLVGFKQFLADQYSNGTPVIIVYPLATPTTETVTGQPLSIQQGTNIVTITQASMDNLTMEVSYKSGVSVTVTEVEDAQLSNDVNVSIGD